MNFLLRPLFLEPYGANGSKRVKYFKLKITYKLPFKNCQIEWSLLHIGVYFNLENTVKFTNVVVGDRWTDIQTGRQTDRQTDGWIGR